MNAVKSTWRQLVRRRLWPVAALLLAAMAAVPVVLAREPEAPIAPVVPAEALTSEADDAIAEPIVAEVTPEDRARRRRVLGVRKDPFEPAPAKKAKADEPPQDRTPAPTPGPTTVKLPDVTGGVELPPVGGGGGVVGVPAPTQPAAPPKRYFSAGTIVVRFGEATTDAAGRFAIEKLGPVPDAELPLLIYMGLTKDGKRARFLVDASVEVDGDGTCKPHPSNCETIELSVGETEFLDVVDPEAEADDEDRITAQYQLDLVDIKRKGDADVK
jgi:hypothetical protein